MIWVERLCTGGSIMKVSLAGCDHTLRISGSVSFLGDFEGRLSRRAPPQRLGCKVPAASNPAIRVKKVGPRLRTRTRARARAGGRAQYVSSARRESESARGPSVNDAVARNRADSVAVGSESH